MVTRSGARPGTSGSTRHTEAVADSGARRTLPWPLALAYALPLLVAVVFLLTHGLVVLGVALLVVELGVVAAIRVVARPSARRPARAPGQPVLGLPGDRPAGSGSRSAVLVAVGLTSVILVVGLVIALSAGSG